MNIKLLPLLILILASMLLLLGCFGPGAADYSIDLPGGYHLVKTSAHNVMITPNKDYNSSVDLFIAAKVVEIDFDDRYIIAKRYELVKDPTKPVDNTYEIPDETKVTYYILDTLTPEIFETYSEAEFKQLRSELSIPKSLELKDPSNYKKK